MVEAGVIVQSEKRKSGEITESESKKMKEKDESDNEDNNDDDDIHYDSSWKWVKKSETVKSENGTEIQVVASKKMILEKVSSLSKIKSEDTEEQENGEDDEIQVLHAQGPNFSQQPWVVEITCY